ncbi:unnamed protein product [Nesidiocoris tenuis]|uniref:Uncharacterized protein n=1 Tax=Nesidiocoris tenuis TaxID=355587 RepID=A0A6H5GYD0_9HEMI|nr:unnamed protein product [Nesidiocoris tenuis]
MTTPSEFTELYRIRKLHNLLFQNAERQSNPDFGRRNLPWPVGSEAFTLCCILSASKKLMQDCTHAWRRASMELLKAVEKSASGRPVQGLQPSQPRLIVWWPRSVLPLSSRARWLETKITYSNLRLRNWPFDQSCSMEGNPSRIWRVEPGASPYRSSGFWIGPWVAPYARGLAKDRGIWTHMDATQETCPKSG